MSNFAKLKRNSGDVASLAKAAMESESTQNYNTDADLYWKLELDKAGNGSAVIRFLPAPDQDGEDALPWVKLFNHGFKGPGGWLIENCPTTKGRDCPVCESNTKLWDTGSESNKNIARDRKRKLTYISNIYVVDDPKHPENNGKVFLFKYGKKIHDMLNEAMSPTFEDEKPIYPFDLWKGKNFKLRAKTGTFVSYDKSAFESDCVFSDMSDEELEAVWKSEHSLIERVSEDKFKTYDQIKTRLGKVIGEFSEEKPKTSYEKIREESKHSNDEEDESRFEDTSTIEDDDDEMKYFNSLVD